MAPPTKAIQKRLDAVVAAFNDRYAHSDQWGIDRWYNSLYPALTQPTTYCAIVNLYGIGIEEATPLLNNSDQDMLTQIRFPEIHKYKDGPEKQYCAENEIICYERLFTSGAGLSSEPLARKQLSTIYFPVPVPAQAADQLLTHWNLDAASVLAAHMLDVQPGDRVLDMCAAPGGKSVVLAQKLFPHFQRTPLPQTSDTASQSILVVNEFDSVRHKRLTANLKSYLPTELFSTPDNPQAPVRVLNKDLSLKTSVSSLPYGSCGYDKVLVDAPCSSERHVIHAYEKAKLSGKVAEEMVNWKSSHVTTLVKTQTGLLQTALKAIRSGGRVVYATCALGREENDGVVERVLDNIRAERKKAKRDGEPRDNWEIEFELGFEGSQLGNSDSVLQRMTESTKYGRVALPDHGGWGPLYFSVMTKVDRTKKTRRPPKDIEPPQSMSNEEADREVPRV